MREQLKIREVVPRVHNDYTEVRSPLCDFRVRENRRHSRGLGWRARVSGRQILEFQVWTGGLRRQSLVAIFQFPFRHA
jgi:hypothetical protein